MTIRRSAVVAPLVLGVALAAAVAGPVQADRGAPSPRPASSRSDHVAVAHGTRRWSTTDRMVQVRVGPANDVVIDLDTRLYVPDNATRRHPQPAILMTHGFGLTKTANEVVTTARFFAAHGYVVLTYTSSGFGASGGCVTLQSADYDVKGASQLIDKVLEPRADVRHTRRGAVVGTIGGSYGGGIQLPLAAADKRVRASIVGRTWNDLQYSLDPNNLVAEGDPTGLTHRLNGQGVFKQEWTSLFFALGNTQQTMGNGGCLAAKQASGDAQELASASSCQGYYLEVCRIYGLLTSTGDSDAQGRHYIARASAQSFLSKINIPVLLVQGQSDTLFNLNDASASYLALRRRHVPVGMIWNSGGHGGYSSQPGECEVYDGKDRTVAEMDRCYLTLRSLGWMDHWLRGTRDGRGPGFAYHRDWVRYRGKGPDDEQYGVARRFRPSARGLALTLSGADGLVRTGAMAGSAAFTNPSGGDPAAYTETSNFTGPDASPSSSDVPPSEVEGQFAAFTSSPFAHRFTSVGIPTARLRLSHANSQDLVFFAKVFDVAPGGSSTLIHRLIAPVRVPAAAVDRPVRIALPGFAHRFRKGHRVRLVLCSTDRTSYNAKVADVVTVSTGPGAVFTLPGRPRR